MLIHSLGAYDVGAPSILRDVEAPSPDLAARRASAAFVPQLVLRFTYRSASDTSLRFDDLVDAYRWPVALGVTFELRAVWPLSRPSPARAPERAFDEPLDPTLVREPASLEEAP